MGAWITKFETLKHLIVMEDRIQNLEKEIAALRERNQRVEAEKAWEISYFRIFSIALITYIVAAIVLYIVGVENYLAAALVPTLGYVLSTLSLPALKRWWTKRNKS